MYFVFMIALHPCFLSVFSAFRFVVLAVCTIFRSSSLPFCLLFSVYLSCLPLCFHNCNVIERLYHPYFPAHISLRCPMSVSLHMIKKPTVKSDEASKIFRKGYP